MVDPRMGRAETRGWITPPPHSCTRLNEHGTSRMAATFAPFRSWSIQYRVDMEFPRSTENGQQVA